MEEAGKSGGEVASLSFAVGPSSDQPQTGVQGLAVETLESLNAHAGIHQYVVDGFWPHDGHFRLRRAWRDYQPERINAE